MAVRENIEAMYRLSPLQQGMLFHIMKKPQTGLYMGQASMELQGDISQEDLKKTFELLIERQPILRTRILYHKLKEPIQVVEKSGKLNFQIRNVRTEEEIASICKMEMETEFNLSRDTLSKFLLIKRADGTYRFVWTFHHIILDAYSVGVLAKEVIEIYESIHKKKSLNLQPVIPYQNYITWLEKRDIKTDLSYWKQYLNGYEDISEIIEYKKGKEAGSEKAEYSVNINSKLYQKLQEYCKTQGVTMNVVFLSIWGLLLQRYTNKKDVVFGTVVSGRSTEIANVEDIAGLFINTIPVRYQTGNISFDTLVQEKQIEFVEACKYWHTPLNEIQKSGGRKGELFNHLVVFENYMYEQILENVDGVLRMEKFSMTENNSYPFVLAVVPEENLRLNFIYNSKSYTRDFIEEMVKRFEILAEQAIGRKDEKVSDFSLMEKEELQEYICSCNKEKELPQFRKNLIQIFDEKVKQYPDKIALSDSKSKYSYREVQKYIETNAYALQQCGIKKGDVVILHGENSIEMVVAILAVLKVGGVYLPIDSKAPQERVRKMLNVIPNSGCIMAVSKSSVDYLEDYQILEVKLQVSENKPKQVEITAEAPAYIMCTSGSTGTPKAVLISQKGIIRLVFGQELVQLTSEDKFIKASTPAFDASTLEMYEALLHGGSLRIVEKEELLDLKRLREIIKKEKITAGFFSTPLFTKMVQENAKIFDGMKYIFTGGDVLSFETGKRAAQINKEAMIINAYGPTENTVCSTWHLVKENDTNPLPIGKRLDNSSGYVVDCFGNLQCKNLPGELYVGGAGVALEYVGNEELTNEKFVRIPEISEERLYSTGDYVWEDEDGSLYFIGRKDNQCKIRGFRIELEEIQNAMNGMEEIDAAEVVVYQTEASGDKSMGAFYISSKQQSQQKILEKLQCLLPEYMIPTVLIRLDEFPMKESGKVDKNSLKIMAAQNNIGKECATTYTEERMLLLWSEVLGRQEIGVNESFFVLGGDSIKGMKLVAQGERKGLFFSLSELYQNQTIKALSAMIDADDGTGIRKKRLLPEHLKYVKPNTKEKYEEFQCNEIQQAYIMGRSVEFELGGFSTHYYTELDGNVEIERMEEALNKVIAKHAMLRTVLSSRNSQKILKTVEKYEIPYHDISTLSKKEQENILKSIRKEMSEEVFDLEQWPLFRMEAYRLSETRVKICFGIDILVVDAASLLMVERELMAYYQDTQLEVKESEFTFRDYCVAMEKLKESEIYEEDKQYWKQKIDEFPLAPALVVDTESVKGKIPTFQRKSILLEKKQWETIKRLGVKYQVTPAAILCTAYGVILEHWSGQNHFALDLTVFDRYAFNPQVAELVGDFTRIMLVEMDFREKKHFWDKVEKTNQTLVETLEHSNYSGVEFIRDISNKYALGTKAAMPYIFTCALYSEDEKVKYSLLEETYSISRTPQVYLDNQVTEKNGMLSIVWDYPMEIWEEEQIDGMFQQYIELLNSIGTEEEGKIQLPEYVKEQYQKYNDTYEEAQALYQKKQLTLNDMMKQAFSKYSENIAVVADNKRLTYYELERLSDEVAYRLQEKKIPKKSYIAIEGHRQISTLIYIVGVLKYGCAYVPINMEYPEERREYIIRHSECRLVIKEDFLNDVEIKNCRSYQAENVRPEDVAYVIFTSGSTGQPKGVVITQNGAANTVADINEKFEVTESDCLIGLSSFGFDLSVYDIFGAFSTGAKLALVKEQRNVKEVAHLLKEEQVTFWNSVPAVIEMFLTIQEDCKNDTLKNILLSGDWIPLKLPEQIRKHFSKANVTSLGGATEASIWSIYYPIPKSLQAKWKSIPYGMPLKNQQIYVMDEQMQLCPNGVRGEICIGGIGIAKEYINDMEKTQEVFVEHPDYGRIYRTGDTGIFHGEYIEFTGRIDGQVKIRGFRIEIGEIEAKATEEETVKDAVVVVQKQEKADTCLVLFYTERAKDSVDLQKLKGRLEKTLPVYMIPSAFVKLEQFPLSVNGKVDRKALPMVKVEEDTRYMQPENEKENLILQIWQQVLERENIGVRQNFFELGGNSIKGMKFISMAEKQGLKIQLPDIFRYNTIEQIAKVAVFSENMDLKNAQRLEEWVEMMESYQATAYFTEAYEKYKMKYQAPSFQQTDDFEHYFITGGAGFFAAHLIVEILLQTNAKVTTLIRATKTEETVEERFENALKFYVPERNLYQEFKHRITVLEGDVSDERMGMKEETYQWLGEKVDCIIHAATLVKHYGLWSVFEKINIQGTKHVAELMEQGREKQFIFISTLSAGYTLGRNESDVAYTEDYTSVGEKSDNFYIQSKINAEEIVEKMQQSGKRVKIFRLGFLVQSYERGIFQMNAEENALFQMLETILRIGHVPDMRGEMFDMTYVDYAAKAVFALMKVKEKGHIYHIFNSDRMSLGRFAQYCRENEMNVNIMEIKAFFEYVFGHLKELSNDMSHLLTLTMADGEIKQTLAYQYKNDKTCAILTRLGFEWPKVTKKQIEDVLVVLGYKE